MTSFSGFVPNDRSDWYRNELLTLLGGQEDLFEQIEISENDFLFLVEKLPSNVEYDKPVHHDLEQMVQALETLKNLYNPGGSAKAVFEGEAIRMVGGKHLLMMRDLFQGVVGESVIMAARRALEAHQVPANRRRDPVKWARMRLVESIVAIAEQAGIKADEQDRTGRATEFKQLLQYVFKRTEINIKPASAISDFIKSRAESGTG